jgi:hypothetical protein
MGGGAGAGVDVAGKLEVLIGVLNGSVEVVGVVVVVTLVLVMEPPLLSGSGTLVEVGDTGIYAYPSYV